MDKQEMQVYTVQSQRLDRIEEKLDQMAQAIIALARAEEKISTVNIINRIFWVILVGLISAVTWEYIIHLSN